MLDARRKLQCNVQAAEAQQKADKAEKAASRRLALQRTSLASVSSDLATGLSCSSLFVLHCTGLWHHFLLQCMPLAWFAVSHSFMCKEASIATSKHVATLAKVSRVLWSRHGRHAAVMQDANLPCKAEHAEPILAKTHTHFCLRRGSSAGSKDCPDTAAGCTAGGLPARCLS